MIKILIIEDEPVAARKLARMLEQTKQDVEVLEVIESKREAIQKIPNSAADLILMDIHLTDGKSLDIFDQINCDIPIVFTTAFDQYVLSAFKQLSIDYLLKPLGQEELQQALDKYEKYFQKQKAEVDFQELLKIVRNPTHKKTVYKNRFLVQIGSKLKPLDITEVAYFYSSEKTTYLVTFEGRTYPIDFSLSQLEQELNPDQFYRVNRQFLIARKSIVNINYVSTTKLKTQLKPPPSSDIYVSTDKIVKFKTWLK